MNKFGKLFVLVLVCTFFICGCGGKKVTCSQHSEEDGLVSDAEIKFTFKDGKIDTVHQEGKMDYSKMDDENKGYMQLIMAFLTEETLCEGYEDCKAKVESKENKYFKFTVDFKFNDDAAESLGLDIKDKSEDEIVEMIKKTYEAEEYTCK